MKFLKILQKYIFLTKWENVGRLGKQGMKETNNEIIAIMVGC